jgi:hypothetical protein
VSQDGLFATMRTTTKFHTLAGAAGDALPMSWAGIDSRAMARYQGVPGQGVSYFSEILVRLA